MKGIQKFRYALLISIFLLSSSLLAQNKWYVNTFFEYAGSHNEISAYNNLFYFAGGLGYAIGNYDLRIILPLVAQNGGMYTQLGKMILRDGGLESNNASGNGEHIKGSVVDGITFTNLEAGIGDILLVGKLRLLDESRNKPSIFAESFIKIPTASGVTKIGTGKIDFGFSVDLNKTIWGIITSLGSGYWILGNPDGYSLNNLFAYSFAIGKKIQKDRYSLFLMYEGYSKIITDYSSPREISLVLNYFLSTNSILFFKFSTGLSKSSPDFIFVSKLNFNI